MAQHDRRDGRGASGGDWRDGESWSSAGGGARRGGGRGRANGHGGPARDGGDRGGYGRGRDHGNARRDDRGGYGRGRGDDRGGYGRDRSSFDRSFDRRDDRDADRRGYGRDRGDERRERRRDDYREEGRRRDERRSGYGAEDDRRDWDGGRARRGRDGRDGRDGDRELTRGGRPQREGFHPSGRPDKIAAAKRARRERMKAKADARKTGVTGDEVPREHEPILGVRRFSSVDYSVMLQIMPPEWYFPLMGETEKLAQAQMDVAGTLARSSVALIATVDNGLDFDPPCVGFLLGRTAALPLVPGSQNWRNGAEGASEELSHSSLPARDARTYLQQLAEREELLTEVAGEARGEDNELMLLVVTPDERGKGVGAALVREFERILREAGQHSYWLQTDTLSGYGFYDANGFTRVAEIELGEHFVLPTPVKAVVADAGADDADEGEGDASDAPADAASQTQRAFMYRKDLGA
ncbi:GNAT family N-acetyltransferase [bacterium]|nr:GNAT family N-acetyltransferase [bacterium]